MQLAVTGKGINLLTPYPCRTGYLWVEGFPRGVTTHVSALVTLGHNWSLPLCIPTPTPTSSHLLLNFSGYFSRIMWNR